MKMFRASRATLSFVLLGVSQSVEVSPIGKVIQMISDLQAKVIGEGEESQSIYDKFSEWCEDSAKQLQYEIKTGKASVEELTAAIEEETETIKELSTKIEELGASIATDDGDLKAATEIREKENAEFVANEKELTQVIGMLERAIAILEREMGAGSAAFLQTKDTGSLVQALDTIVQAAGFSFADASRLTALVQSSQESGDDDTGAPAAEVYESKSGNIVATLQGLLEKAESQLDAARKAETTSANNYAMMKQSLEDAMKFAKQDMAKAKKDREESEERKATAEGDLSVTSKDLKEDETALADLHHQCMTKAEDFEAETKSRGEELAALAKAKQVIKEATGGAAEQTYDFFQVSRSKLTSGADLASFEVVRFVRELARKQKAPALAQLASRLASTARLSSGADVFAKIKGLISDMISKLEDEAAADATHKAYCDKELGETKDKEADKNAEIEKLSTKINQMTSKSAKLKEEVARLQKELAELAASQAKMDEVREEENAAFSKNRPEMEKGLEGVKLALQVLRDYYGKGDAAHGAAEGAGATIIGLLEVCESDFSKGLAEMIATEEAAQAEYDQLTKDNEVEKATKDQDVKYKTKESTDLDKAVGDLSSDRDGVQAELDAILEYLKKLEGECVAKAETYEERKARRDAEIAGLKEAMGILGGEALLLQRSSRRTLRM